MLMMMLRSGDVTATVAAAANAIGNNSVFLFYLDRHLVFFVRDGPANAADGLRTLVSPKVRRPIEGVSEACEGGNGGAGSRVPVPL